MNIKEYFERESRYLYHNIKCDGSKAGRQKDNLSYIFNYFIDTKQNLCENCSKGQNSKSIKINEINNICHEHFLKYIKYCKDCDKHFCSKDNITCQHSIIEFKYPKMEEINTIKNKLNMLIKYKEINDYLIKFLNTLLITYKEHPSNYYNRINITNVVNNINFSIVKKDDFCYISKKRGMMNINDDDKENLLYKINNLEKIILKKLNVEYQVNLTGEELKINLNRKEVDNIGLIYYVPFPTII